MGLLYGDPEELDRLAGVLQARAGAVRQAAGEQVTRAVAARWVSSSAQAYRDRLAGVRAEADRVAGDLEEAAAILRAHAQEVRDLMAAIARAEREVSDWLSARADDVVDAAEWVVRKGVPWVAGPLMPPRLPPSGDRGWLEIGQALRGREVT